MTITDVTQEEGRRLQGLLASSERIGQTGSWEFVPSEDELRWSDNCYRIFGLEPGDVEPSIEYVVAQTHVDDRQHLRDAIDSVLERGRPSSVACRITRPDGDRRHLRATLAVAEHRQGEHYRIIGVIEDLTDRHRAEREIAAHVAVAETLVGWQGFEPGARRLLARLAAALECLAGVFWVPRGDVLVPRVFWQAGRTDPRSEAATRATPLPCASGLAARAWSSGKPLSSTLACADTGPPAAAGSEALSAALAIPALMGEGVLAVVELRSDCEIRVSDRLMRSLTGISHELGQFLSRRVGELGAPLLTPREVEMLQLAAEGLSARETAERLTVTPATVRTHLENVYRKLEISGKPSAVAAALRLGLIR